MADPTAILYRFNRDDSLHLRYRKAHLWSRNQMSRRDRKPLAKSRSPGDRPKGATPFRSKTSGDRPQGNRPGGKSARFAEPRRAKPAPFVAEPEKIVAEPPPLPKLDTPKGAGQLSEAATKTLQAIKDMILFEDADVMVLNKPAGLAVQGGSGITRNVDDMLEVMRDAKGQKPRLVHRLDRETSGCLLIAKTRFAATALTGSFRHRSARKIYWALVAGRPKTQEGPIPAQLAKG